jgi:hypothetical protein
MLGIPQLSSVMRRSTKEAKNGRKGDTNRQLRPEINHGLFSLHSSFVAGFEPFSLKFVNGKLLILYVSWGFWLHHRILLNVLEDTALLNSFAGLILADFQTMYHWT